MTYLLIHGKMSKVHLTVKYSGYSAREKEVFTKTVVPKVQIIRNASFSHTHACGRMKTEVFK